MIASEQQAREIGERLGKPFEVFRYVHPHSNLTLFGVKAGDETITSPRAAASAQPVKEK